MSLQDQEYSGEPARQPPRKKGKEQPVFEMLNAHAGAKFKMIPKEQLKVPTVEYQRDESEGRIAKDIAMHFCKVSFGCLTVIEQKDGTLFVADGGTRLSAALMRKDIKEVPCYVFTGLTRKQEADVFMRINQNRRKLQTEQLQHAEVFAGHALALKAEEVLNRLTHSRVGFDSLSTIRRFVKSAPKPLDVVLNILCDEGVAVDKHVNVRVMKGLVRLEMMLNKNAGTLTNQATINKIRKRFGLLDTAVNAMVQPRMSGDPALFARAIARTLNIRLPSKDK